MTGSARHDKRYKASHPLQVRCDSWSDFVQLYAGDVSQGGMFIITDEPHEILSEIDVRLTLPETHQIQLRGRVVHVMTPEMAEAEGRKPGVGVEFKNITPEMKQQIVQLIEYARWEGSGGDPKASFASRMFEAASHTPVADVLKTVSSSGTATSPTGSAQPGVRITGRVQKTERPEGSVASKLPRSENSVAAKLPRSENSVAARLPRSENSVAAKLPRAEGSIPSRPPRSENSVAGKLPRDPEASQAGQLPSNPDMSLAGAFPSDPIRMKEAMQHIGAKRHDQAIKVLQTMIEDAPQDVNAKKWLYLTQARDFMRKNEPKSAILAYEQALTVDENNHEAREAVRTYHRNKRLSSLPFGRYFMKKK
jgi:Tfp pilus assembly protein PilZ